MVLIRPAVLAPATCAHWLARIDACAAALPPGHADLQPASDSLRLSALGAQAFDALLREAVRALDANLPTPAEVLAGQSWARRQHPPAARPPGALPHGWHQDGALHSRFTAAADDALLDITTVWIALVDCGAAAPSLEWTTAPTPRLLLPPELTDAAVAGRYPPEARRHALLAAGDALVFSGDLLHRTFVTSAMHLRRVSIELRFIARSARPARLAHEPRIRCSSTR